MPVFWKSVLGVVGTITGIFLLLCCLVWIQGGSVLGTLGIGTSVDGIEDYEIKEEFAEQDVYAPLENEVYDRDKGTMFENYITSMPKEIEDGLYVLYNPEGMDVHKATESLPRYIKQETAYPVYIFYMSDPKSAVVAYEIYAEVTGKEFSEDVPLTYLVVDGKIEGTYGYLLKASEYPTMENQGG